MLGLSPNCPAKRDSSPGRLAETLSYAAFHASRVSNTLSAFHVYSGATSLRGGMFNIVISPSIQNLFNDSQSLEHDQIVPGIHLNSRDSG
jgi:hypothetical protein